MLAKIFTSINSNNELKAVIITGDEKSFVAGADIKEMAEINTIDMYLHKIEQLWEPIAHCTKPIIAAVNGYALGGGCELAMHADIIIAGENAIFGQPEVKVGIMPGSGGTQRLPRAIGRYKAMRLLLTGEMISGVEAYEMGLVSYCVKDEECYEKSTKKVAEKIAQMPPIAIAQIKRVVNYGYDLPLDAALILEREAFITLFQLKIKKKE